MWRVAAVIGLIPLMFSAALGIGAGAADADAGDPAPTKQRGVVALHRNKSAKLDAKLELGERILNFLRENYGEETAANYGGAVRGRIGAGAQPTAAGAQPTAAGAQPTAAGAAGSQPRSQRLPRLPHRFWEHFIGDEMRLHFSDLKRVECQRALVTYIERSALGATTRIGLRQGRRGVSQRNSGAAENRQLAPGLGFQLLQYFVDYLQNLYSRADSLILMTQAREMRAELLLSGTLAHSQLPKLSEGAGKKWFQRWRKKYGIGLA